MYEMAAENVALVRFFFALKHLISFNIIIIVKEKIHNLYTIFTVFLFK